MCLKQEIAQLLKVSHISVKRWFRADGLLKEEYDRQEKERNGVRDRETDTVLARHADTAARMLVSLMGARSDAMKFRAAKTILDFVLGPATTRDNDDELLCISCNSAEVSTFEYLHKPPQST